MLFTVKFIFLYGDGSSDIQHADNIAAFWNVVNGDEVSKRFAAAK